MDQILELIRLIEALPAAWGGLMQIIRDLAYGLLPSELDTWLAANEWLLWGALLIVALVLVVTVVGSVVGGE
ncbi:MAG: hypothetical protein IT305_23730 [Chloroflexi bacterium]|nr:hypothetical protein [Chloroflexota bacterium]